MPELPEVETVRKALEKRLRNKSIKNINIIYPKIFENQDINFITKNIKNQKISSITRKGKWLIFNLDDYCLLSHLRMEGKYIYRTKNDPVNTHEHVIFNIDDEFELRYQDVRKFGKMYLVEKNKLNEEQHLSKLGFEPWDKQLNISYLKEQYHSKILPIKTILLDQTIIAGIGNIYADEILFLSRINPHKKARELVNKELESIIENTKIVLDKAIKEGGTTIRSYTSEEGVDGRFQNNLMVHQRLNQKCYVCNSDIIKEKIGGRGTFYCPNCQKLK